MKTFVNHPGAVSLEIVQKQFFCSPKSQAESQSPSLKPSLLVPLPFPVRRLYHAMSVSEENFKFQKFIMII